jgi:hypothetical protein
MELTWTAIATGAGVPVITLFALILKTMKFEGNMLRVPVVLGGMAFVAYANHAIGRDWTLGLVIGFLSAGAALGLYHWDKQAEDAQRKRD